MTEKKKDLEKFDSKLSNKETSKHLCFLVFLNKRGRYEKEIILLEKVMKILNFFLKIISYFLENIDF